MVWYGLLIDEDHVTVWHGAGLLLITLVLRHHIGVWVQCTLITKAFATLLGECNCLEVVDLPPNSY